MMTQKNDENTLNSDNKNEALADDTEIDALMRRLRKRMLLSATILGVGIFAVIGAVVWKLVKIPGGDTVFQPQMTFSIPADREVSSVYFSDNDLFITLKGTQSTSILVIDLTMGNKKSFIKLQAEK